MALEPTVVPSQRRLPPLPPLLIEEEEQEEDDDEARAAGTVRTDESIRNALVSDRDVN